MTFEQIKSNFRVCQIGDNYYIQIKTRFGWSFNTEMNVTKEGYPELPMFCIILCFFSLIILIIFIIISFSEKELNIVVILSSISSLFSWLTYSIYNFKSKRVSVKCNTLNSAELTIDNIANSILKKQIEKEKEKSIKYHYFYSDKQLRKEKLKKLK